MRAVVLTKFGKPEEAFEIQERPIPTPKDHEICIQSEAFGLNFADVMARQGLYQDCPPLPTVLGYEVVGKIHAVGKDVKDFEVGQRVVSLTRFGGYAEYAVADARAAAVIPDEMDYCVAAALATQYATAYFCAAYTTQLHKGEHVLIQAAAGGVGTALVQMAKHKGCIVYGTAGSEEKLDYLRSLGVDHPINYNTTDFATYIEKTSGKNAIDVAFDSLGGSAVKKARKLLAKGTGRIICYGAASRSGKSKGVFGDLKLVFGFGFLASVELLLKSQGVTGVNMLRVADNRPDALKYCIQSVVQMVNDGILNPTIGGKFSVDDIAKAHNFLGERKSIGKVAVHW
ncbi:MULTISPECIES: zinc-binding dehydrogenase [unclassified Aureispira]|uniref:quinone oxidoreductase family protein n=1 Tax=unclassified Aureispira TaxID=2649989 RepID=UPI00069854B3|nr:MULTISPECIES: zinc-binding dehydrogenase [unclassified Aureispira]WMX14839.1 zinc-binding dehydrogenase [Aureispira sp. CCB-E]